jgi:branched-chain amino acid transport system permease protein
MIDYLIILLTYVGFYLILALALNFQWGMTGMVNFGVAGFYGIGAYASGLLAERLGMPVALAMPAAAVITACVGLLVSLLAIRLRADYFAIATLGFAEIVRLIALNESWLTEGPKGLKVFARPFAAIRDRETYALVYLGLVFAVVLVIYAVVETLSRSPYGRVLRAIREDDVVASALGKNVIRFRMQAFALGCAFMGIAGALFCHYIQTISPDTFMPMVTIFIWMSVIVGGAGNNNGLLIGAGLVMMILEGSRFLNDFVHVLDAASLAAIRIIVIGVLLILAIRFRPRGLVPARPFRAGANQTDDTSASSSLGLHASPSKGSSQ